MVNTEPGGHVEEGLERDALRGLPAPACHRLDLVRRLTPAQTRVLIVLLEGVTVSEAATRMGLSRHTVHDHAKDIYKRLGAKSRVQLVYLFTTPPGRTDEA